MSISLSIGVNLRPWRPSGGAWAVRIADGGVIITAFPSSPLKPNVWIRDAGAVVL